MPLTYGPRFPTTAVNTTNTGAIVWAGVTNVYADDTSYATATTSGTTASDFLDITGFGFSLPINMTTINGITVNFTKFRTGGTTGNVRDNTIQLLVAGVPTGNNKATTTSWGTSTTTPTQYGTSVDIWGLVAPTYATINNSGFGVRIAVQGAAAGANRVANVDFVTITVYATGITYTQTVSTSSSNTVALAISRLYLQTLTATPSTALGSLLKTPVKNILGTSSNGGSILGSTINSPTNAFNNTSIGTTAWSNPTNIYSTNSVYASVATLPTQLLIAQGYGFSIPSDATITGVQVKVNTYNNSSSSTDQLRVGLWLGNSTSLNQTIGMTLTVGTLNGAASTQTYGSSTYLWGTTLTPAIVNDSTFGARFDIASAVTATQNVDSITIQVFYTSGVLGLTRDINHNVSAISDTTNYTYTNINTGFTTAPMNSLNNTYNWSNLSGGLTADGVSYASQAYDYANSFGYNYLLYSLSDLGIPSNAIVTDFVLYPTVRTSSFSGVLGFYFCDTDGFGANSLIQQFYPGWAYGFGSINTWSLWGLNKTLTQWGLQNKDASWWNASTSRLGIATYKYYTGTATNDVDGLSIILNYKTPTGSGTINKALTLQSVMPVVTSVATPENIKQPQKDEPVVCSNNVSMWITTAMLYLIDLLTTSYNNTSVVKQLAVNKAVSALSVVSNIKDLFIQKSFSSGLILNVAKQLAISKDISALSYLNTTKEVSNTRFISALSVVSTIKQLAVSKATSAFSDISMIKQLAISKDISALSDISMIKQLAISKAISAISVVSNIKDLFIQKSFSSIGNAYLLALRVGVTIAVLIDTSIGNNVSWGKNINKYMNPVSLIEANTTKEVSNTRFTSALSDISMIKQLVVSKAISALSDISMIKQLAISKAVSALPVVNTTKEVSNTRFTSALSDISMIKQIVNTRFISALSVVSTMKQIAVSKAVSLINITSLQKSIVVMKSNISYIIGLDINKFVFKYWNDVFELSIPSINKYTDMNLQLTNALPVVNTTKEVSNTRFTSALSDISIFKQLAVSKAISTLSDISIFKQLAVSKAISTLSDIIMFKQLAVSKTISALSDVNTTKEVSNTRFTSALSVVSTMKQLAISKTTSALSYVNATKEVQKTRFTSALSDIGIFKQLAVSKAISALSVVSAMKQIAVSKAVSALSIVDLIAEKSKQLYIWMQQAFLNNAVVDLGNKVIQIGRQQIALGNTPIIETIQLEQDSSTIQLEQDH